MMIHSPQHGTHSPQPGGCRAGRLFFVGAALLICFATTAAAEAQSSRASQLAPLAPTLLKSPTSIRDGLLTHGDETFRVINAGTVRTAADLGDSQLGSVSQVAFKKNHGKADCVNCAPSAPCAPCRSYGDLRTNYTNPCGSCDPFYYVTIEALYMEPNTKNRFSLSSAYTMGQYDFQWAPRLTVGSVPDCVHGYEFAYVGQFEWSRRGALSSGGSINSLLTAGFPLTAADLTSFNSATFQSQTYDAQYWSVEANSTLSGWDVAKLLGGVRYINYDEQYVLFSQTATETGVLRSALDNRLLGLHLGMDLLYPICEYGYLDFRSRIGGFVNFVDASLQHINDSATVLLGSDDKTRLAGLIELGGGIRFQLGRSLSIRAGGELWYISGLATASRQLRHGVIGTNTISSISPRDDLFVAGVTFGGEFKY